MNGLWQRAADRIRDELGQVGYETWIGPLNFVAHQGSTVTIEAPNRFFRDWINERYLSLMRTALSKEAGEEMEVRLTLGENAAVATPQQRPASGHANGHANSNGNGNGKATAANRATAAAAPRGDRHPCLKMLPWRRRSNTQPVRSRAAMQIAMAVVKERRPRRIVRRRQPRRGRLSVTIAIAICMAVG